MSIIPKINVGLSGKKRSKMNLDFDNSTTLNVGTIQPTMCREMVPNESFKVKVSSLVRLAPMPVPTFARMSLRHYHCFVPYAELWEPFTAFLSQQSYTSTYGNAFVPSQIPTFPIEDVFTIIASFSDISFYPNFPDTSHGPLTITESNQDDYSKLVSLWSSLKSFSTYGHVSGFYRKSVIHSFNSKAGNIHLGDYGSNETSNAAGVIRLGGSYLVINSDDTLDSSFPGFAESTKIYGVKSFYNDPTAGYITPEAADFIFIVDGYLACCKLKAPAKRLRSIFIGLGYSFSPISSPDVSFNWFKLLAYYKCWYELFSPNRERTFNETSCYKLIKTMSNKNGDSYNFSNDDVLSFILDLIVDCYYYLPMDYFGMSVQRPYDQFYGTVGTPSAVPTQTLSTGTAPYSPSSGTFSNTGNVSIEQSNHTTLGAGGPVHVDVMSGVTDPVVLRLANRLLTFAGKNTVVGRQIQDYLRAHYGIVGAEHHTNDSSVYRLGSSRVQINVSDIMSTADTESAKVGDYAGKGIGYGDSDVTEYTAKEFGCWITLSVIVPESGYYQGYFLENRHKSRYDFFTPEFDALGYQVLERGEIVSDLDFDSKVVGESIANYKPTVAFGFVPRYSHMKVGRNIVNGDLSLSGLQDSMSPYYFDRKFPTRRYIKDINGNVKVTSPEYLPSIVSDSFRRIDPTDRLGNYNRIFNYTSNDVDHFIVHNIFNVTALSPMKPLAESFDTVVEDDKVVQVTKA